MAFTSNHALKKDGSIAFDCSSDIEKWPWLALPTSHPIFVQTINFWASVESGKARGTYDPEKWSALTYTRWQAGPGKGPVSHGLADLPDKELEEGKQGFRLKFFNQAGDQLCQLVGTGVVFQTRDFEAWRETAKQRAVSNNSSKDFQFAEARALGVETDIERFLSPLSEESPQRATAYITRDNALMPQHPYHSGSGDHVNSSHLADAGFQFCHLIEKHPLICTGGEMTFRSYVELGKPFQLTKTSESADSVSMSVHQGGTLCTDMTMRYQRA